MRQAGVVWLLLCTTGLKYFGGNMELNNQQTEKVRTVISLFFNQYIKIYTSCILGNVDKQEFVDLLNLLDLTKNEVRDVMHDVFGINEP